MLAAELAESGDDAHEDINDIEDAMVEIEKSNTELEEVNQVVRLIRERTNVINEIVFKTQMLSFNANIEAARAGQHGLGFHAREAAGAVLLRAQHLEAVFGLVLAVVGDQQLDRSPGAAKHGLPAGQVR